MSAALDFQDDPAMTKAQSKLFVLQPVRRSGRARPSLLPALKKSTTRLREAATRDKGSSGSMRQSGALGAVGGGRPLRRPYFSSGFSHRSLVCQVTPARHQASPIRWPILEGQDVRNQSTGTCAAPCRREAVLRLDGPRTWGKSVAQPVP
jgi:hypothetical protein